MVSDEGPVFSLTQVCENIEEVEKAREQPETHQAFQDFLAKSAPLRRKPATSELHRVLVGAKEQKQNVRYRHFSSVYPAPDKAGEARTLLIDLANDVQAERPSSFLLGQLFGSQGQVLTLVHAYETLTEYDNYMTNLSASAREVVKKLGGLSRAPIVQQLRKVLIATPS